MGSPAAASAFAQRVIIGVGDLAVSNAAEAILSTYALGSCIGVAAYDAALRVGGILHFMLPDSNIAPAKAAAQPAMFADTGLPLFFRQLATFGAPASRLQLFLAGGASVIGGEDPFRIGERNRTAALAFLAGGPYRLAGLELGGSVNRTLHLDLARGILTLKAPRTESQITLVR
jgi:chemotaxis protein CheD